MKMNRAPFLRSTVNATVLVQCVVSVCAILDPVDFLALQSIQKSLWDVPGSSFFASWDFTSDPCNFVGVYCDGDRVVTLNLGDPWAGTPGLMGRIDPAIGHLSSIVELTVVPGRVMGPLPLSISELKNLQFLGLGGNFISGEIPASLGMLQNLRTLDLGFNQLTGSIPSSVGSLPQLTNLILSHNKLSGPVPPFMSLVLSRIDLKHNYLCGPLRAGSLPPSLHYLSLSWNWLSGPVDELLNRLNRLNSLDLSMNQFTGNIPATVFTFPITNLQLQRNSFTGPVDPASPVTIPTVDLSYNQLSGPISPMLSTVENLYLNNNRFTGQVPGSLVDRLLAGGMQLLYLQHNYLTSLEIDPRAEIPPTSSMCIQYNCMVPPIRAPCPLKAGKQQNRPRKQCIELRG
ncbi:probably inactive leucine-rich repeat receptor-like protein kinase IMK2 [Punica granatum]|uniref:Leucine-rich repeat-containing N-terminal plant-type domain-containing protein n=2 Tax=Punica granatum TaxID=22663 RepID=A0A218X146_PUNGR|nr:probably inactive leucine-rich repeat receptor-like protein kinase IMK2 [Punica granatum]OWM78062.1 hypothetical protein CDL15_Pgr018631 [Punica granatum]PKI59414.1 hypothetical protein CRG98_020173 [Punica granatum]